MNYSSLFWEDVEDGHEIPSFTYEMSQLRLVAFLRATGLYDYIHFDRDYAQSVGARDAFASTPHISGLFSRLLTDWTGPTGEILSMNFSMRAQACAGDFLTISGKVGRKYRGDDGAYLIDVVALNIASAHAPSVAAATATLALPSREGGPVKPRAAAILPPVNMNNCDVPDFAQHLVGIRKEISYRKQPLAETEIHLFCEALEDWDPRYWDKSYPGSIVAPPLAMLYGAGSSAGVGVGYGKPGEKVPAAVTKGLVGREFLQSLRQLLVSDQAPLALAEFPEVVISDCRIDCYAPFLPGDELRAAQEMVSCGPLKKTRLGEGHFFTWVNFEFNQDNVLVKSVRFTMFLYRT